MKPNSQNLVMSALFGGRQGQRPPVGNPTSIACHGLMDKAGASFPQAHLDAGAMADPRVRIIHDDRAVIAHFS